INSGRQALEEIVKAKPQPTAVFTANDLMALGMIWAAKGYDMQIPKDLSIVGLDDIELGSQITPPLTTVSLPRYEIGSLAMQMLLDQMDHSQNKPVSPAQLSHLVETNLVIRKSTMKPNHSLNKN
ncbi:MAG: substrate-binding domain-containing protein, partial [Methanosarcinaceae archaeon]|nr:substrate-binding domain-containing protein [Methanosarcinaceae archaeon]